MVVHTALLELLTPAEVQAVLAHELGHLKCDHGVWLTAANVLALVRWGWLAGRLVQGCPQGLGSACCLPPACELLPLQRWPVSSRAQRCHWLLPAGHRVPAACGVIRSGGG